MALSRAKVLRNRAHEIAAGGVAIAKHIPRITPGFSAPMHLLEVTNLLAATVRRPVRACISVPPRHSKTESILHAIPWLLSVRPDLKIAYVTYAGDLARIKSQRAMDIAGRARIPIRRDRRRATDWETSNGGAVIATGIGGPLTGKGADLLIVDDPIKNREEAESKTLRDKNYEWFTSTALTRLEPGASCIVLHTRWHEDDLIGRLLREQGDYWEYVNLPAIGPSGEALWPERWPLSELNVRRQEIGEYDWASLYMGQPRPKGGRLFEAEPEFYDMPSVESSRVLIACDPAATARNWADHSAIVVGAARLDTATRLPRIDILEVHRMQVEVPTLVEKLAQVQRRWAAPVAIEAVGGFKAVPQMLRHVNRDIRIIDVKAGADKFTRALPAAAAWNSKRIRVPRDTSPMAKGWLRPFLSELRTFTGVGDAEDDQVDALAHLVNVFTEQMGRTQARVASAPNIPWG